jgi:hypothetical protein
VIVALAGLVTLYIGYRYAKSSVEQLVAQYTDTAPAAIERVELPVEELQMLQKRMDAFGESMKRRDAVQELILTAHDINGLIHGHTNLTELRDKLFVRIDGERIQGDISVPLPNIGPLKFKGRYLNGVAAFKISLTNDLLDLRLDKVEVNGKPLPESLMSHLRSKNLSQDHQNDPETQKLMRQLESIQITDGKIILRNKVKSAE